MLSAYISFDGLRVTLVLFLAVAQAGMAFWPDLRGWPNTIASRSAALRTPLVPPAWAFAIWGPIFLGCLVFAVWQALPDQLRNPVVALVGWLVIVAFAVNTAWEWLVPKRGFGWTSAALAVLEWGALAAVAAVLVGRAQAAASLHPWFAAAPLMLFFGWVTAAVFVCMSSVLRAKGYIVGTRLSLALLVGFAVVALGSAAATGSVIFAAATAWAAFGVAVTNWTEGRNVALAAPAAIVAAALPVVALVSG